MAEFIKKMREIGSITTKFGAYLVSIWLVLIALTLLAGGKFPDVAVRDLVMAIGAYSLGRITQITSASV